jgi:hypothetical protein
VFEPMVTAVVPSPPHLLSTANPGLLFIPRAARDLRGKDGRAERGIRGWLWISTKSRALALPHFMAVGEDLGWALPILLCHQGVGCEPLRPWWCLREMAGAQGPNVSERRRRGIHGRGTRQLQREVEVDNAGPQTSGRVWSARESQRLASGPRVSAARHACGAWAEMGWRGGWRGKWARSLTVGPVAQFFFYSIPDFNYPNQISSFVLNSRFKVKKSLHELYFCSLQ